MAVQTLYDADFYGWTQEQTRLIRSGELSLLDYENILEEIAAIAGQTLGWDRDRQAQEVAATTAQLTTFNRARL